MDSLSLFLDQFCQAFLCDYINFSRKKINVWTLTFGVQFWTNNFDPGRMNTSLSPEETWYQKHRSDITETHTCRFNEIALQRSGSKLSMFCYSLYIPRLYSCYERRVIPDTFLCTIFEPCIEDLYQKKFPVFSFPIQTCLLQNS